ncbi:collagen binding domain-containing protein [Eubacteriales bacterium KG125]
MFGKESKKLASIFVALMVILNLLPFSMVYANDGTTYSAYDSSRQRQVVDQTGVTDSDWSLCMNENKLSPGTNTKATGKYIRIENATEATHIDNGGEGDFQKIKRMLFYKLKNPNLNYAVFQHEYYFQQGNKKYDTNWGAGTELEKQKNKLRSFIEDPSYDSEIEKSMEIIIYHSDNSRVQNLISARLLEQPTPEKTKVNFSKKALTEDGEELAGAKIKLTKKDGTVVKEWETDGKLREFELEEGSYTFTEVSAPDKYEVATAITFEVKDGKVLVTGTEVKGNTIVMVDKLKEVPKTKVNFSKKALTEDGEELAGAKIKLTKKDGTVVKEWETDGKLREFELEEGSYTFTEVSAPDKYEVATAITFEVKDGKVSVTGTEVNGNTIVMVDKLKEVPKTKVNFSKKALTEDGEELAGAKIKLTKKDGTVVKEWITDGKVTEFELEEGSYTFTEISAPDKYQVATSITFEVKDGKVSVTGTEVNGNTIVMVDKLKEVPKTKVNFSKKALTEDGEELAGAKIKLTKKDGTVVKEWETDGKLREFELEEGSYTFTEVSAPDKYEVATAITFEVKDGKVLVTGTEVKGNTIVMVDKLKEVPPTEPKKPGTLPKTGDGFNPSVYAGIMALAGGALTLLGIKKRKEDEDK